MSIKVCAPSEHLNFLTFKHTVTTHDNTSNNGIRFYNITLETKGIDFKLYGALWSKTKFMVWSRTESELTNTDYEICSNKADNFFASHCFCNPPNASILEINWLISKGPVVNGIFARWCTQLISQMKIEFVELQTRFPTLINIRQIYLHIHCLLTLNISIFWESICWSGIFLAIWIIPTSSVQKTSNIKARS